MKKKLLPICAMALLTVGYSSVASASTGTLTKEESAQMQQEKEALAKKEAAIKAGQKNDAAKQEVAKQAVQGEKLPNTASNNVAMMALSACLVAIGTLFGLNRRNKIKA
ncbi:LPXTG cell wall anchor domain-containing protein [Bacillus mycoides]|uniref:LPXTG cell wall anchor domain-containing protein n=1 Tax=Bacillus mycoides TaxID=1405 RepID=UPI003CF6FA15